MGIGLLLKVMGIGFLVSVAYQVLHKSGRDEQAILVSVAGIIIVLLLILGEFSNLINTIRSTFGI